MKVTHNSMKVKNKEFIVPEQLGGKIKFNDKGIAEVDNEAGKYLIAAGFVEVTSTTASESKSANKGTKE